MRKLYLLLMFLALGCRTPVSPKVAVALADSNHAIKITGFDTFIAKDIATDTSNNFEHVFAIYRMPADTEMKDYQPVQTGKYQVQNGAVVFKPDTAFVKGQTYFVRYYQFNTQNSVWDFVTKRKSATKLNYNDLIFKP